MENLRKSRLYALYAREIYENRDYSEFEIARLVPALYTRLREVMMTTFRIYYYDKVVQKSEQITCFAIQFYHNRITINDKT